MTAPAPPPPDAPLGDAAARQVVRTYLLLTLLSTLAASFIWGINTLFLLDAGLSNAAAFAELPVSMPSMPAWLASGVLHVKSALQVA